MDIVLFIVRIGSINEGGGCQPQEFKHRYLHLWNSRELLGNKDQRRALAPATATKAGNGNVCISSSYTTDVITLGAGFGDGCCGGGQ